LTALDHKRLDFMATVPRYTGRWTISDSLSLLGLYHQMVAVG